MSRISITDLPTDVLYTVFPYLTALEFLRFTSTCKALISYRQDSTFWRTLTQNTFRIPPQPLLQAEGARWVWLYRRLLTQTRLYTWGNDDRGSLGFFGVPAAGPPARPLRYPEPSPQKIDLSRYDLGVIADVACGGWSTTILNSIGVLFLFGNFEGLTFSEAQDTGLKQLTFPEGYPPTTRTRYEPSTAIKQFSNGRNYVLGLADDGKVWYWSRREALQIKFFHVNLTETNVSRVVGGWRNASIYIPGTGIIYWIPQKSRPKKRLDTLVIHSTTIPGTSHTLNGRTSDEDLGSQVGEVINHVVLEDYIVFITKLNKVFAYKTTPAAEIEQPHPFELTSFYTSSMFEPFQVLDIQGSFQTFAVFTAARDVLLARRPLLDAFFEASIAKVEPVEAMPKPTRPPYLQQQDVIYLAMGDHHIHALHANGTVSSFGNDPRSIGAFGLGYKSTAGFRGVQTNDRNSDVSLPGTKRRTIFFEPIMQRQVYGLRRFQQSEELDIPVDDDEQINNVIRVLESNELRDAYGDYFEEEAQHWEDGITAENEMGAYFAFKVSASGWHSAALVLVDEEKVERLRQRYIVGSIQPRTAADPDGLTARDDAARLIGEVNDERAMKLRYTFDDQPLPRLWERDGRTNQ